MEVHIKKNFIFIVLTGQNFQNTIFLKTKFKHTWSHQKSESRWQLHSKWKRRSQQRHRNLTVPIKKEALEEKKVGQSLCCSLVLLHQSSTMLSRPLSFSLQASSSSRLAMICRSNSCSRHAREAGLAEDQPAAPDCSSISSSWKAQKKSKCM